MSFEAKHAIAAGIRALREEKGESTEVLADALTRGAATVYRWQNGSTTPGADDLYAVAAHYSTSMDDVVARGREALRGKNGADRAAESRPAPTRPNKRRG